MESYKELCRLERIADVHLKAKDAKRARAALRQVQVASDAFEHDPAKFRGDVVVKLREAASCLATDHGCEALSAMMETFSVPKNIDSDWTRALRMRLEIIDECSPGHYAANLLRSILAGVEGARPA